MLDTLAGCLEVSAQQYPSSFPCSLIASSHAFSLEVIREGQRWKLPVLVKVRPRTDKFHFCPVLLAEVIIDQPGIQGKGNKIPHFNGMNIKELTAIFNPPDPNSFIPPVTLRLLISVYR